VNRLADAASPYLQQHADNPVDWYEWGDEAFERARAEDKPIFLSVGYSSCHWCHVMAHESFEDDGTAAVLNERFVSVKVDREERPDVDAVYMNALQAMTGHGGWPMSVFLTPDGVPFLAGTYWPKEERQGMPSFGRVLDAVHDAWTNERDKVRSSGAKIAEHLEKMQLLDGAGDRPDADVADRAASLCVRAWDATNGGFGGAPKFPQAMTIDFLLASYQRTGDDGALRAATHSLEMMSRGGIYDHVAGGFARYSVDQYWLVPHFEKMLYDNALLLRAYTHAWQVTGEPRFRRVATEVGDYLLRDMRHERGGLFSATDADSEGEEGKFFVWSLDEFREVVAATGEDPDEWVAYYGVSAEGNFEGANILHENAAREEDDAGFTARVDRVRQALFDRREQRVHPGLDDKVLTSWNGLALGALAETGAALGEPRFVEAAAACAAFLADELVVDGRLRHSWKDGHGAGLPVFSEDVAFLAQGLLSLYEATGDTCWFTWASQLAKLADEQFADSETASYFSTPHDGETLLTRPRDMFDNATPSPTSVMADVHLRLGALSGDGAHARRAEAIIETFAGRASQAPTGFGELLRALERLLQGPEEVAVVGAPGEPGVDALTDVYRSALRPGSVLAVGEPDRDAGTVPLLAGRSPVDGLAAAYVCRNFACERPVTDPADLAEALGA
jgi:uncharacterized protein